MGLACPPEYSNSIFSVLDGPDATDSPVRNSNAITNRKTPSGHSLALSVFPAVRKKSLDLLLLPCTEPFDQCRNLF
jgi:hypothetical protein